MEKKQAIKLNIAAESDAKEIVNIYAPYVQNTAITFEYQVPTIEEMKERIRLTKEKYPYIVAYIGDQLVGYGYVSPFKTRAAYDWSVETSVYVREDKKHSGIGKAIYSKLEEILNLQHILNVNACIAVPNDSSVSFHENFGYKKVAEFHECGYKLNQWHNIIWMEKFLNQHQNPPVPFIKFPELNQDLLKKLLNNQ